MQLNLHTAGNGQRMALLIHGLAAYHGTWHAVETELVARGYRVVAPDLRGHGRSGRAGSYQPEEFADDLAASLPAGADVAIGHSLGGLALSLAVTRLQPARAIYSDPVFVLPVMPPQARKFVAQHLGEGDYARNVMRAMNPGWSEADMAAELSGLALPDQAVIWSLADLGGRQYLPQSAAVPPLVQVSDRIPMVSPEAAGELRHRGFEVVTVPGGGHNLHHDLAGFLASLDGWA